MVPAGLRLLRRPGGLERQRGGPDIRRAPRACASWAAAGRDDGRAQQALDSVRARLATPHGIVLNQPSYTRYHLELGEISSYPPGYKENGSVFCHTNPWVMIAETLMGDGDAAFDYYKRINPSAREAISEVHRAEPYVYAQTIAGPDARHLRGGEELVVDGNGGVELRGHFAVDPRDPPRSRRAAGRPRPARGLGRVRRGAGFSGAPRTGSRCARPPAPVGPGRLPGGRR